jgi:uncharacterized protein YdeI (YjbR/CyaY-like superfamily)
MELYVVSREEWRKWLDKNHLATREVWLIYYKKLSGKPRIPYIDAVEEALCFGWIDGKIKRINEDYFKQRFTPLRPGSRWSKYNIERVKKLLEKGEMREEGMEAFNKLLNNSGLVYDNRTNGIPLIPVDLQNSFDKNITAHDNFLKFSPSSRRMYIDWLNSAKKTETRLKRIEKIIHRSEKSLPPGMM